MSSPVRLAAALLALSLAAAGCGGDDADELAPKPAAGLVAAATPKPAAGAPTAPTGKDDAEAAESFAVDGSQLTKRAPAPQAAKPAPPADDAASAADGVSPGAPSDAQIKRELEQMEEALEDYEKANGSGPVRPAKLNRDGTASPPKGAPEAVRRIIAAGNAIAKFPYVYGGGHGSFVDTAYDCSGSVSYALAAAGIVDRPMVSGEFMKAGEPGRGKWVTIYAHEGHMYMEVAGLRFDTSGRGGPLGSRWQLDRRSSKGFEVRHPTGL